MTEDGQPRIEALERSFQTLDHSVAALTDQQAREDSLLPSWSRGHVLTHLARNADAMVNLVTWAKTGIETPMYPSREERDADIEAGAGRPAQALVADVQESNTRLIAAIADLSAGDWEAPIRFGKADREGTAADIPGLREVEVEVHHVDLDLDYTIAHWPEAFVERMLSQTTADYSARPNEPSFVLVGNGDEGSWRVGDPGGPEIIGPPPALLGWLLGRTEGTGLQTDGSLPKLEAWR